MAIALAQVRVQALTGVPRDAVMNTFHFGTGPGITVAGVAGDIATAVQAFYHTGSAPYVSTYLSDEYAWTLGDVKIYDLSEPEPRVPVAEFVKNLGDPGSVTSLPAQIAVCASYQGDKESGLDQASRRGRLYVGPLNTNAVSSGDLTRPSGTMLTALLNAMDDLYSAGSDPSFRWVVYSPKLGTTCRPTNGWVDNRFDVQRRRGVLITSKTVRTFT